MDKCCHGVWAGKQVAASCLHYVNCSIGQGWANYGPSTVAETPKHVEFYETCTIFIKTWNFMKIVYV